MKKHPKQKKKIKLLLIEALVLLVLFLILGLQLYSDSQKSSTPLKSPKKIEKTLPLSNKTPQNTVLSAALVKKASPSAQLSSSMVNYGRSVHVPILMYHYIGNNPNPADTARYILSTAPDKFDAQMGYLQSAGYTPITLDTMYAGLEGKAALPLKPIVLTFDDGYIDFYINAYPILRKYGFHAVSFIPTGLMDQGYYLHWSQIKVMASSGLISFEAHSISHPDLTHMSDAQIREQVTQSKQILQSEIGTPVNFFAYPYGTSNVTVWAIVKQAGFLGALGTWYGTVESEATQYDWPRVRITGGIPLEQYKKLF